MVVIVIGCESKMHDASPHSPLALTSPKGMAVGATGADGVAAGVDLWICSNSYGLGPRAVPCAQLVISWILALKPGRWQSGCIGHCAKTRLLCAGTLAQCTRRREQMRLPSRKRTSPNEKWP